MSKSMQFTIISTTNAIFTAARTSKSTDRPLLPNGVKLSSDRDRGATNAGNYGMTIKLGVVRADNGHLAAGNALTGTKLFLIRQCWTEALCELPFTAPSVTRVMRLK